MSYDETLAEPHVRAMDFTGCLMAGYIYDAPEGVRSERELTVWLPRALTLASTLLPKKPSVSEARKHRK